MTHGYVVDVYRDPHTSLDEVAPGVPPQAGAEVGEHPGVRDLDVVVEPVAAAVDAQARQSPIRGRGGHQKTTLA